MPRWAAFAVPFAVVFLVGIGAWGWSNADSLTGPSGPPVEVADIAALDPVVHRYVSVPGMAHYTATVKQVAPATLTRDETTEYLFGLFDAYDTDGRAIRVMVRTERPPERLVSYELMKVTGELSRATPEQVPYEVEVKLGRQSDYFFSDDMLLLDAEKIEPWDPPGDAGDEDAE